MFSSKSLLSCMAIIIDQLLRRGGGWIVIKDLHDQKILHLLIKKKMRMMSLPQESNKIFSKFNRRITLLDISCLNFISVCWSCFYFFTVESCRYFMGVIIWLLNNEIGLQVNIQFIFEKYLNMQALRETTKGITIYIWIRSLRKLQHLYAQIRYEDIGHITLSQNERIWSSLYLLNVVSDINWKNLNSSCFGMFCPRTI